MNYLTLFSPHNLALLSDWLQESGELYVDVYLPHSGGGSSAYLVRSIYELKALISDETHPEIDITIFRNRQFPLRGVANDELLEQALQMIPDGNLYSIVSFDMVRLPWRLLFHGDGRSHDNLRREFAEVLGEKIGIGQEPVLVYDNNWYPANPDQAFHVSVYRSNEFSIKKNQDFYAAYAENAARYQQIIELWQA